MWICKNIHLVHHLSLAALSSKVVDNWGDRKCQLFWALPTYRSPLVSCRPPHTHRQRIACHKSVIRTRILLKTHQQGPCPYHPRPPPPNHPLEWYQSVLVTIQWAGPLSHIAIVNNNKTNLPKYIDVGVFSVSHGLLTKGLQEHAA